MPSLSTAEDAATDAQRLALRRHRMGATGLLIVMACLLIVAHSALPLGEAREWLRAASEAAVVGGLADWFAVTALFRHPLGLPIPHTALIPRNQRRIARRLGSFVTENFLAPDLVQARLSDLDLPSRFGRWIIRPENAALAADTLAALAPQIVRAVEDRRLQDGLKSTLNALLRGLDPTPFLVKAFLTIPTKDYDAGITVLAGTLRDTISMHREEILARVSARNAWWLPKFVDRRMAEAIVEGCADLLADLCQPSHEVRQRFDAGVRTLVLRLRDDPQLRGEIITFKNRIVRQPAVQAHLSRIWEDLREAILDAADTPHSRLRRSLAEGARGFGERLLSDDNLREALKERLAAMAGGVVPWRKEIGAFIEDVVNRWDSRTVADRIELAVGRDLQYIRVNGTVVGAIVGCLLHALSIGFPLL